MHPLDLNAFLLHLSPTTRLWRPSHSEFLLLPLCGVSETEVIPHSSESKHSLLWAFKLCLFLELYVCEHCSGDPHTPSPLTPAHQWYSTPGLSPVYCMGKYHNPGERKEHQPIRNLADHLSAKATPSSSSPPQYICHIAYINRSCVPNPLAAVN